MKNDVSTTRTKGEYMKRLILIVIIIFTNYVLFAGETNAPDIEEEVRQELDRIVISPDDSMTYEYYTAYAALTIRFNYKNRGYVIGHGHDSPFPKMERTEERQREFYSLLSIGGVDTLKLPNYETMNISNEDYTQHFANAVRQFNDAVKNRQDVRQRLTFLLRESLKNEIRSRIQHKHWEAKLNEKPLCFIGLNIGGFIANSNSSYNIFMFESILGLRFEYYFLKPFKKFNMGFSLNINYQPITAFYAKTSSDSQGYLTFIPGLVFKFFNDNTGYQHNFVFSVGGLLSLKLTKNNVFLDNEYTKTVYGAVFTVGYRYVTTDMGFTFGVNSYIQITNSLLNQINSGNSGVPYIGMGVELFFGFRI